MPPRGTPAYVERVVQDAIRTGYEEGHRLHPHHITNIRNEVWAQEMWTPSDTHLHARRHEHYVHQEREQDTQMGPHGSGCASGNAQRARLEAPRHPRLVPRPRRRRGRRPTRRGASPTLPATSAPSTTTAEQAVPGSSRCEDLAADTTTESQGDLDLLQTSLQKDAAGLHIVFQLSCRLRRRRPTAPGVGDPGGEALTSWGIFMAADGQVLYGLVVERRGNAWSTSLTSFLTEAQDRRYPQAVPGVADIQVTVPGADLPSLPAAFDWWAWTDCPPPPRPAPTSATSAPGSCSRWPASR